MTLNYIVEPTSRLYGTVRVPGDKSISHRVIMIGALADGITEANGFLAGADCLATVNAFRAMGVQIEQIKPDQIVVHGVGLHGLHPPSAPIDLGNSGTAMRLMTGLLAGQAFDSVLIGDASLMRRPMKRVTEPLRRMGAHITTGETGTAPLHIRGGRQLYGIDYALPVASAQVKSAVLLAGLYAIGQTCVIEPQASRDHTERLLRGFGYPVSHEKLDDKGLRWQLEGGGHLKGVSLEIPADISSAAFFLVGASIAPQIAPPSEVVLRHVGINPTRIGVIDILRLMGADLDLFNERQVGGEPIADIRVRSAPLRGIHIPTEMVPRAIDEFPALFIAAACAEGQTVLTGAQELRVKESDRIAVMAEGLKRLGIDAEPQPDGLIIRGGVLKGGEIESHGDHRVAMAFAMAALRAEKQIVIRDCANVDTSFPGFITQAQSLGLRIAEKRG